MTFARPSLSKWRKMIAIESVPSRAAVTSTRKSNPPMPLENVTEMFAEARYDNGL